MRNTFWLVMGLLWATSGLATTSMAWGQAARDPATRDPSMREPAGREPLGRQPFSAAPPASPMYGDSAGGAASNPVANPGAGYSMSPSAGMSGSGMSGAMTSGPMQAEGYGLAGERVRLYVFGQVAMADYRVPDEKTGEKRVVVALEEETNLPLPDKNFLYYREPVSGTRWAVGRFPREDRSYSVYQQKVDATTRKWQRYDVVQLLSLPPQQAAKSAVSRPEGPPMARPALDRGFQRLQYEEPAREQNFEETSPRREMQGDGGATYGGYGDEAEGQTTMPDASAPQPYVAPAGSLPAADPQPGRLENPPQFEQPIAPLDPIPYGAEPMGDSSAVVPAAPPAAGTSVYKLKAKSPPVGTNSVLRLEETPETAPASK